MQVLMVYHHAQVKIAMIVNQNRHYTQIMLHALYSRRCFREESLPSHKYARNKGDCTGDNYQDPFIANSLDNALNDSLSNLRSDISKDSALRSGKGCTDFLRAEVQTSKSLTDVLEADILEDRTIDGKGDDNGSNLCDIDIVQYIRTSYTSSRNSSLPSLVPAFLGF